MFIWDNDLYWTPQNFELNSNANNKVWIGYKSLVMLKSYLTCNSQIEGCKCNNPT